MIKKRKRGKRGLNKRLAGNELLKLSDGKSEIYVTPARHGTWQIVAPPEFVITAELVPGSKALDISNAPAVDSTNRPK